MMFRVWGRQALFAVPHLRADAYSYEVMPPSAMKGILRSLYGKPEIEWEIGAIEVLNPIIFDTTKVRNVNKKATVDDERTLSTITALVGVDYVVHARFTTNPHRAQRSVSQYAAEVHKRLAAQGQEFRTPCFGRREYPVSWKVLGSRDEAPPALPITKDLGTMLFDQLALDMKDHWEPVFARFQLENGVMHVPHALYDRHRAHIMRTRHERAEDARSTREGGAA